MSDNKKLLRKKIKDHHAKHLAKVKKRVLSEFIAQKQSELT